MRPMFVELGFLRLVLWVTLLWSVLHAPAASADEAAPCRKLGPWAEGLVIAPGMDASGRILRQSVFIGLDLRNAKFDGAHLGGAEIYQCDLRNASLAGAVLTGVSWGDCNVDGADFSGAVLNGAKPIHGVSGFDLYLTHEQFVSTRSYRKKDLSECVVHLRSQNDTLFSRRLDLRDADLRNAAIGYCDLRNSDLTNAKITGTTFDDAVITDAAFTAFRKSELELTAEQLKSTWNYKHNRMSGIHLPTPLERDSLLDRTRPSHERK